jgi:hypothetical protein
VTTKVPANVVGWEQRVITGWDKSCKNVDMAYRNFHALIKHFQLPLSTICSKSKMTLRFLAPLES